MLKDNILRSMLLDNENSAKPLDTFEFPMEGYLKIVQKDMKTGEIIHVDEDHNKVLQWARHATFHCLTGSPFSQIGATRNDNISGGETYHSNSINKDGTIISGEQFFTDTSLRYWANSTLEGNYIYSYYPTKILFGTSAEFTGWDDPSMTAEYKYEAQTAEGYTPTTFNTHINTEGENIYSDKIENGQLLKCRTINDVSASKTNTDVDFADYGIQGAIKTMIRTEDDINSKTSADPDGYLIENPEWRGIGDPCFIYSKRDNTPETDSDVLIGQLSDTQRFDNKLSFSFNMPEQNDSSSMNKFYPYNGYLLKEAGLFCDSNLIIYNSSTGQYEADSRMPCGIVFAKRYVAPFTKSGSTAVSVNWVLYY